MLGDNYPKGRFLTVNRLLAVAGFFIAAMLSGWQFLAPSAHAVMLNGEDVPLHRIPSIECRQCHMQIYEQWKGSMHAQSTALRDPIHRAFYKMLVGDPAKEGVKHKASGKYPVCLKCHAPNAAQDGKTKLDEMPAYEEGVNCMVCHRLKSFKGTRKADGKLRLGLDAYEVSDVCQGPSGFTMTLQKHAEAARGQKQSTKDNPHIVKPMVTMADPDAEPAEEMALPLESNPSILKTSAACLGCHDKRKNPQGVDLCQTGDEYIKGNTFVTCQSCHMPVSGGVADHSMGGGHKVEMLRRALLMTLKAEKNGTSIKATVSIQNQQPHKVPTGAPFRNMAMKVTAFDADGNTLWTNFKKHPAKEDPKAYFVYLMGKDGKPAGPPVATEILKDTRLVPYEKRQVTYDIPADKVSVVRVEMFYNLLWAGLVKKMTFLPQHLKEPKRIAFAEQRM